MTERERIEAEMSQASEQILMLRNVGVDMDPNLAEIPIDVYMAVFDECSLKIRGYMEKLGASKECVLTVMATIDEMVDDVKSRRVASDCLSLADFGRNAASALASVKKTSREFRALMAWSVVVVSTLKLVWH